jgi:acetyl esterase/lipase
MGSYISWGQLTAASGFVAITYTNTDPATDALAVVRYVRQNAASLGVDENRIAVWACSGSVPTALSVLMHGDQEFLKAAVLIYGYTLDDDESTSVADAARQWGFATPCAGKSVDDLPRGIPLFIARSGRDQMPGLNVTLDRFLARALSCNLPVTFTNHATAPHAFDLFDDGDTSREIIRQILAFLRFNLLPHDSSALGAGRLIT